MEIAPSVLAANFVRLEDEIRDVEQNGADILHLDVMDGHFVPNISFGPPVIKSIRTVTNLPLDVHLMTYNPQDYLDVLESISVQYISFHVEAVPHLDRMIQNIKGRNIKAGIALNPGTPIGAIEEVLPLLDYVLIMSVNPGFGGQKFITYTLDKVIRLKDFIINKELSTLIEIDGGVNKDNARLLKNAGADILVAGSSVFNQPDRKDAIESLKV